MIPAHPAHPHPNKSALIQQFLRDRLLPLPADPLFQLAGTDDFEPSPVDDVVYR
jgi:hypothetical protein